MTSTIDLQVKAVRKSVRRNFGALPYPLLNVALRELDQILMDRVGTDPARAYGEQREYDLQVEAALRAKRLSSP